MGNIQDLLQNPEICKILLKKPRHYHNKNRKKSLNVHKKTEKASGPITKPKQLVSKSEPNEKIYCPTPINKFNFSERFSNTFGCIADNNIDVLSFSESTKNSDATCKNMNESFFKFGMDIIDNFPHTEFFHRNDSRKSSFKSVGYDDVEFVRGGSRKNSDKYANGFSIRKEGITVGKGVGTFEDLNTQFNFPVLAFPPYSPTNHFQFYGTPKHQK